MSGVAELIVGPLLLVPRTRRIGALAAIGLFVVVYPANFTPAELADEKLLATNFITPTRYAQRKRVIALPGIESQEPFIYPRRYAEAYAQILHGPKEGALDDLAVELEHEAQYAVRRRMLRAEVQGVVLDFCHVSSHFAPGAQCRPP